MAELDRRVGPPAGRYIVLVADDPELAALAARLGCLSVHLVEQRAAWPVSDGVLHVDDLTTLEPLLQRPSTALGSLFMATEPAIRARHELAAAPIREAIGSGNRILVFGAGTIGRQVVRDLRGRGIEPRAMVDSSPSRRGTTVDALTVVSPAEINTNDDLVVVAVGMAAADIEDHLDARGVRHRINLSQLGFAIGTRPEIDFAQQLVLDRAHYAWLYTLLADDRSRRTLDAVICHRLTLENAYLARLRVRDEPQWFDRDVVADADDHVLADGGAYDGDSIAAFSQRFRGRFRRAYGFEPDPALAARAAARHAADPRVQVVPRGLSDHVGKVRFAATGATDGRVAEAGDASAADGATASLADYVDVVSLDAAVSEPVTFLKLDVEGAELAAMRGAAGHIADSHPTLALAAYHRASDLRDLPLFIAETRRGDRLYLRHYTDVGFETVLYAVPSSTAT